MTSRRTFGIGVDLVVTVVVEVVPADEDNNGVVSMIDGVDSVTIAVVVEVDAVVDTPFATSSITSSMCDRVVTTPTVDGAAVTDVLSVTRLFDETMFETIVIKSFC